MQKITVNVGGMMCTMCETHIAEAIRKAVPGAKKVSASRSSRTVTFISEQVPEEETVKKAITDTGYDYHGMKAETYVKKALFSFLK